METFDTFDDFDLDELTEPGPQASTDLSVPPRRLAILWLIAGGVLLSLIPISLLSKALVQEIQAVETAVAQVEGSAARSPTPPPEVLPLLSTLETLQASVDASEEAGQVVSGTHDVDWPEMIATLRTYNAEHMALTVLNQEGRRLRVQGRAAADSVVVDYAQSLEASGRFNRVLIRSINRLSEDELQITPTPMPELDDASAMTAEGAEDLIGQDAYEIDDFDPADLVLDQPQIHTFHPIYDIDKVTFLAKSGRHYRIYTTDLSPGVDTFLTVDVGGTIHTNDDRTPGNLGSEITFQVAGPDTYAVVKISNRGLYGPDKQYHLAVKEVIPEPTPDWTPTPRPTAMPTQTPRPRATSTPDARDAYEVDDTSPKPIALAETQAHNFFPDGDVDQLVFLAKAGRRYHISTSNLESAVDTVLTVALGQNTYTNDDRAWGDLSSALTVAAPSDRDVEARIRIANRGQYGPHCTYQVTLKEVEPRVPPSPTPTATPSPTPTATPTLESSPIEKPKPTLSPTETPTDESVSHTSRLPGLARLQTGSLVRGTGPFWGPRTVEFTLVLEMKGPAP